MITLKTVEHVEIYTVLPEPRSW